MVAIHGKEEYRQAKKNLRGEYKMGRQEEKYKRADAKWAYKRSRWSPFNVFRRMVTTPEGRTLHIRAALDTPIIEEEAKALKKLTGRDYHAGQKVDKLTMNALYDNWARLNSPEGQLNNYLENKGIPSGGEPSPNPFEETVHKMRENRQAPTSTEAAETVFEQATNRAHAKAGLSNDEHGLLLAAIQPGRPYHELTTAEKDAIHGIYSKYVKNNGDIFSVHEQLAHNNLSEFMKGLVQKSRNETDFVANDQELSDLADSASRAGAEPSEVLKLKQFSKGEGRIHDELEPHVDKVLSLSKLLPNGFSLNRQHVQSLIEATDKLDEYMPAIRDSLSELPTEATRALETMSKIAKELKTEKDARLTNDQEIELRKASKIIQRHGDEIGELLQDVDKHHYRRTLSEVRENIEKSHAQNLAKKVIGHFNSANEVQLEEKIPSAADKELQAMLDEHEELAKRIAAKKQELAQGEGTAAAPREPMAPEEIPTAREGGAKPPEEIPTPPEEKPEEGAEEAGQKPKTPEELKKEIAKFVEEGNADALRNLTREHRAVWNSLDDETKKGAHAVVNADELLKKEPAEIKAELQNAIDEHRKLAMLSGNPEDLLRAKKLENLAGGLAEPEEFLKQLPEEEKSRLDSIAQVGGYEDLDAVPPEELAKLVKPYLAKKFYTEHIAASDKLSVAKQLSMMLAKHGIERKPEEVQKLVAESGEKIETVDDALNSDRLAYLLVKGKKERVSWLRSPKKAEKGKQVFNIEKAIRNGDWDALKKMKASETLPEESHRRASEALRKDYLASISKQDAIEEAERIIKNYRKALKVVPDESAKKAIGEVETLIKDFSESKEWDPHAFALDFNDRMAEAEAALPIEKQVMKMLDRAGIEYSPEQVGDVLKKSRIRSIDDLLENEKAIGRLRLKGAMLPFLKRVFKPLVRGKVREAVKPLKELVRAPKREPKETVKARLDLENALKPGDADQKTGDAKQISAIYNTQYGNLDFDHQRQAYEAIKARAPEAEIAIPDIRKAPLTPDGKKVLAKLDGIESKFATAGERGDFDNAAKVWKELEGISTDKMAGTTKKYMELEIGKRKKEMESAIRTAWEGLKEEIAESKEWLADNKGVLKEIRPLNDLLAATDYIDMSEISAGSISDMGRLRRLASLVSSLKELESLGLGEAETKKAVSQLMGPKEEILPPAEQKRIVRQTRWENKPEEKGFNDMLSLASVPQQKGEMLYSTDGQGNLIPTRITTEIKYTPLSKKPLEVTKEKAWEAMPLTKKDELLEKLPPEAVETLFNTFREEETDLYPRMGIADREFIFGPPDNGFLQQIGTKRKAKLLKKAMKGKEFDELGEKVQNTILKGAANEEERKALFNSIIGKEGEGDLSSEEKRLCDSLLDKIPAHQLAAVAAGEGTVAWRRLQKGKVIEMAKLFPKIAYRAVPDEILKRVPEKDIGMHQPFTSEQGDATVRLSGGMAEQATETGESATRRLLREQLLSHFSVRGNESYERIKDMIENYGPTWVTESVEGKKGLKFDSGARLLDKDDNSFVSPIDGKDAVGISKLEKLKQETGIGGKAVLKWESFDAGKEITDNVEAMLPDDVTGAIPKWKPDENEAETRVRLQHYLTEFMEEASAKKKLSKDDFEHHIREFNSMLEMAGEIRKKKQQAVARVKEMDGKFADWEVYGNFFSGLHYLRNGLPAKKEYAKKKLGKGGIKKLKKMVLDENPKDMEMMQRADKIHGNMLSIDWTNLASGYVPVVLSDMTVEYVKAEDGPEGMKITEIATKERLPNLEQLGNEYLSKTFLADVKDIFEPDDVPDVVRITGTRDGKRVRRSYKLDGNKIKINGKDFDLSSELDHRKLMVLAEDGGFKADYPFALELQRKGVLKLKEGEDTTENMQAMASGVEETISSLGSLEPKAWNGKDIMGPELKLTGSTIRFSDNIEATFDGEKKEIAIGNKHYPLTSAKDIAALAEEDLKIGNSRAMELAENGLLFGGGVLYDTTIDTAQKIREIRDDSGLSDEEREANIREATVLKDSSGNPITFKNEESEDEPLRYLAYDANSGKLLVNGREMEITPVKVFEADVGGKLLKQIGKVEFKRLKWIASEYANAEKKEEKLSERKNYVFLVPATSKEATEAREHFMRAWGPVWSPEKISILREFDRITNESEVQNRTQEKLTNLQSNDMEFKVAEKYLSNPALLLDAIYDAATTVKLENENKYKGAPEMMEEFKLLEYLAGIKDVVGDTGERGGIIGFMMEELAYYKGMMQSPKAIGVMDSAMGYLEEHMAANRKVREEAATLLSNAASHIENVDRSYLKNKAGELMKDISAGITDAKGSTFDELEKELAKEAANLDDYEKYSRARKEYFDARGTLDARGHIIAFFAGKVDFSEAIEGIETRKETIRNAAEKKIEAVGRDATLSDPEKGKEINRIEGETENAISKIDAEFRRLFAEVAGDPKNFEEAYLHGASITREELEEYLPKKITVRKENIKRKNYWDEFNFNVALGINKTLQNHENRWSHLSNRLLRARDAKERNSIISDNNLISVIRELTTNPKYAELLPSTLRKVLGDEPMKAIAELMGKSIEEAYKKHLGDIKSVFGDIFYTRELMAVMAAKELADKEMIPSGLDLRMALPVEEHKKAVDIMNIISRNMEKYPSNIKKAKEVAEEEIRRAGLGEIYNKIKGPEGRILYSLSPASDYQRFHKLLRGLDEDIPEFKRRNGGKGYRQFTTLEDFEKAVLAELGKGDTTSIGDARKELDDKKRQRVEQIKQAKKEAEQNLEQAEEELQRKKDELENAKKETEEAVAKAEEGGEEPETISAEAKEKIKQLEEELESQQKEAQALNQTINFLENERHEFERALDDVRSQIARLKEESARLKEGDKSAEGNIRKILNGISESEWDPDWIDQEELFGIRYEEIANVRREEDTPELGTIGEHDLDFSQVQNKDILLENLGIELLKRLTGDTAFWVEYHKDEYKRLAKKWIYSIAKDDYKKVVGKEWSSPEDVASATGPEILRTLVESGAVAGVKAWKRGKAGDQMTEKNQNIMEAIYEFNDKKTPITPEEWVKAISHIYEEHSDLLTQTQQDAKTINEKIEAILKPKQGQKLIMRIPKVFRPDISELKRVAMDMEPHTKPEEAALPSAPKPQKETTEEKPITPKTAPAEQQPEAEEKATLPPGGEVKPAEGVPTTPEKQTEETAEERQPLEEQPTNEKEIAPKPSTQEAAAEEEIREGKQPSITEETIEENAERMGEEEESEGVPFTPFFPSPLPSTKAAPLEEQAEENTEEEQEAGEQPSKEETNATAEIGEEVVEQPAAPEKTEAKPGPEEAEETTEEEQAPKEEARFTVEEEVLRKLLLGVPEEQKEPMRNLLMLAPEESREGFKKSVDEMLNYEFQEGNKPTAKDIEEYAQRYRDYNKMKNSLTEEQQKTLAEVALREKKYSPLIPELFPWGKQLRGMEKFPSLEELHDLAMDETAEKEQPSEEKSAEQQPIKPKKTSEWSKLATAFREEKEGSKEFEEAKKLMEKVYSKADEKTRKILDEVAKERGYVFRKAKGSGFGKLFKKERYHLDKLKMKKIKQKPGETIEEKTNVPAGATEEREEGVVEEQPSEEGVNVPETSEEETAKEEEATEVEKAALIPKGEGAPEEKPKAEETTEEKAITPEQPKKVPNLLEEAGKSELPLVSKKEVHSIYEAISPTEIKEALEPEHGPEKRKELIEVLLAKTESIDEVVTPADAAYLIEEIKGYDPDDNSNRHNLIGNAIGKLYEKGEIPPELFGEAEKVMIKHGLLEDVYEETPEEPSQVKEQAEEEIDEETALQNAHLYIEGLNKMDEDLKSLIGDGLDNYIKKRRGAGVPRLQAEKEYNIIKNQVELPGIMDSFMTEKGGQPTEVAKKPLKLKNIKLIPKQLSKMLDKVLAEGIKKDTVSRHNVLKYWKRLTTGDKLRLSENMLKEKTLRDDTYPILATAFTEASGGEEFEEAKELMEEAYSKADEDSRKLLRDIAKDGGYVFKEVKRKGIGGFLGKKKYVLVKPKLKKKKLKQEEKPPEAPEEEAAVEQTPTGETEEREVEQPVPEETEEQIPTGATPEETTLEEAPAEIDEEAASKKQEDWENTLKFIEMENQITDEEQTNPETGKGATNPTEGELKEFFGDYYLPGEPAFSYLYNHPELKEMSKGHSVLEKDGNKKTEYWTIIQEVRKLMNNTTRSLLEREDEADNYIAMKEQSLKLRTGTSALTSLLNYDDETYQGVVASDDIAKALQDGTLKKDKLIDLNNLAEPIKKIARSKKHACGIIDNLVKRPELIDEVYSLLSGAAGVLAATPKEKIDKTSLANKLDIFLSQRDKTDRTQLLSDIAEIVRNL